MEIAKVSDYRGNLAALHSQIINNHNPLMVSGREGSVVILAADDYDNIIETMHILKDKVTMNSLQNVREQINKNRLSGKEANDVFSDIMDSSNK